MTNDPRVTSFVVKDTAENVLVGSYLATSLPNVIFDVTDSAMNVSSALDELNGMRLGSVALEGAGDPELLLTADQTVHDTSALAAVTDRSYQISVPDFAYAISNDFDELTTTPTSSLSHWLMVKRRHYL